MSMVIIKGSELGLGDKLVILSVITFVFSALAFFYVELKSNNPMMPLSILVLMLFLVHL